MAEQFERTFVFERSTKNKHLFREVVPAGAAEAVGGLYIDKSICPDAPRRNVRISVEFLTGEEVAAGMETV